MEDAATAEISRAQLWQWIRYGAELEDGRVVNAALCRSVLEEELAKLSETAEPNARYPAAAKLFGELIEAPSFAEFLTVPAYDMIIAEGS
jgi:malate synthase